MRRRGGRQRERGRGLKLSQADRAMRIMPVARLLHRSIPGLRSLEGVGGRMLMPERASGFDPGSRPHLYDVEDELDRQQGLNSDRAKDERSALAGAGMPRRLYTQPKNRFRRM